jgi:hypothetical protein
MRRIISFINSTVRSLCHKRTYVSASRYLELLDCARGSTLNEQIEFLSALGVVLSHEGVRELQGLVDNESGLCGRQALPHRFADARGHHAGSRP